MAIEPFHSDAADDDSRSVDPARVPDQHRRQSDAAITIVVACAHSGLPDAVRNVIATRDDMRVVGETDNCQEALELVRQLKPSILLFSIEIHNLDSDAIGRVLRSRGKQRTRGVAVVCPHSENDALRAIRLGCSGTVPKDAPSEVVVECLTRVHAGETWLDPLATTMLVRQFVSSSGSEKGVGNQSRATPFEATALTRVQRQIVLMMGTVVRRAQRAEEASRAKSRVLANMSHQLRTLLNAIIGFSELLLNEVGGPINDRQREFLEDSLTCGRELRVLINSILDLAKIEAGKMEVLLERLNPAELIRTEVVEVMRSTAILKGISLEISGSVGDVVSDSRKLKHIVENYVSNAIKYSPANGKIVVRLERKPDDAFSIEVVDQGPGIGSEKLRLLFNRFQQLEGSSSGSTGLGLALTKELTELLGGQVGVTSVPGQGSTFFVVLPITGPAIPAQPKESHLSDNQPRILVVEDESADRAFLRRALARVGYRVDSAAHLRDAIRKCKTTRYDAITLDLVLGDDDGTALLREIGSLNQDTPVIVVSTTEKPVRHCQTRVYAQLRKPIQPLTLFESLNCAGVFPKGQASAVVAAERAAEAGVSELEEMSPSARNGI